MHYDFFIRQTACNYKRLSPFVTTLMSPCVRKGKKDYQIIVA
jgi:hypothetical protein